MDHLYLQGMLGKVIFPGHFALLKNTDDLLIGLFFFLALSCVSSFTFWKLTPYQMDCWRICSPMQWVASSFCWWFLLLCKSFLVWCSPICLFFHLFPLPEEIYWQKYCKERCLRFYCLCFLLGFLWFRDLHLSLLSTLSLFLWMDLEIIMLCEISQAERDKYHIVSLICRI